MTEDTKVKATPFYKKPIFWIVGAIAILFLKFIFSIPNNSTSNQVKEDTLNNSVANTEGNLETTSSVVEEIPSVAECSNGGTKECIAANSCTGSQSCVDGVWGECNTSLQKCADDSCRESCPICYAGQTQNCTSSNGCTGSQSCNNENWEDCTTSLVKCNDGSCLASCPIVTPTPAPTPTPTPVPTPNPTYTCNCSKTCEQITTCAEAQYQLKTCGCTRRDGDKDGIACDNDPLNCQHN